MTGLLRRSPYLVFFWAGRELFVENYLTHVKVAADPIVLDLLELFGQPQRVTQLAAGMPGESKKAFLGMIRKLTEHDLLEPFDGMAKTRERATSAWERWGVDARFFHWGTKDVKYMRPEEAQAFDLACKARSRAPSAFKRYPGAERIALPPPQPALPAKFTDVLHARRTQRDFNGDPITLHQLSTLLGLTWGVDRWVDTRTFGRFGLKTSPSAGARYPIEVYVAAQNVNGLKQGLYHYSPNKHQLHVLRLGNIKSRAEEFCAGQWWTKYAGALFLMTAVFERTMWRYGFSRALRTVYLEAGHFCQTVLLTATALNLASFCTAAFADSLIERELGIDGLKESMLYVAAAGHANKR